MAPITTDAGSSVVLFDFDGTLSEIVDEPSAARPRPGVVDELSALVGSYLRLGVISGRPVSFLVEHMADGLYLSGLYGLEESVDGATSTPVEVERWGPVVAAAVADLGSLMSAGDLVGTEVEDKGLSVTVHYRRRPDRGEAVVDIARRVAGERGLDLRAARMSVELHPPVPTDKGHVVRRLVEGLDGCDRVMFVGDDVGDLPAFEELGRLRQEGLTTLAVAVASSEMDPRVHDAADLVISADQVGLLLSELRAGAAHGEVAGDDGSVDGTDPASREGER